MQFMPANAATRTIERVWRNIWITCLCMFVLLLLGTVLIAIVTLAGGGTAPMRSQLGTIVLEVIGSAISWFLFFLCIRAMRVGSEPGFMWLRILLWLGAIGGGISFVTAFFEHDWPAALANLAVTAPLDILPLVWLSDPQFPAAFAALRLARSSYVTAASPTTAVHCRACGFLAGYGGGFCTACGAHL